MDLDRAMGLVGAIGGEVKKVIVGQPAVIEQTLVAYLAGGHVLLEGAPGTAKTLLVRALALAVGGVFRRVQFTPDLMPTDITGVNVYQADRAAFSFRRGPIFCDILLADEINRAPAKTQSALLEAMQERQVSVDGEVHPLSRAFTVVATQNPIEYEGTYPLPEAQLDRFMFKVLVGYPDKSEEERILSRYLEGFDAADWNTFAIEPCISIDELCAVRETVKLVTVSQSVIGYITEVIRATRGHHGLTLGASPRAAVMLLQASRSLAVLRGRTYVTPDDVRDLAAPVLRHRIILSPETEIEGTTPDHCVARVLEKVPVPRL
jgi:MoxR-like ATPase